MNPARSRDGLAAGVLAAAVHGFFVLLLVLGVSWQIHDAQPAMADIWQALPEPARAEPEPAPLPKPAPPQANPRPAPDNTAADIALEKKKQREAEELKRKQALEAEKKKRAEAEKKQALVREQQKLAEAKQREELRRHEEEELRRQSLAQALAAEDRQLKARDAAVAAAAQRAAETDKLVARYTDLISARIRENTRLPEGLAGNPQAEFRLSVLPSGDIARITLLRSSGNPAYDQAVLRGIEKSSPLPLPAERAAMERFRDLQIKHKARE